MLVWDKRRPRKNLLAEYLEACVQTRRSLMGFIRDLAGTLNEVPEDVPSGTLPWPHVSDGETPDPAGPEATTRPQAREASPARRHSEPDAALTSAVQAVQPITLLASDGIRGMLPLNDGLPDFLQSLVRLWEAAGPTVGTDRNNEASPHSAPPNALSGSVEPAGSPEGRTADLHGMIKTVAASLLALNNTMAGKKETADFSAPARTTLSIPVSVPLPEPGGRNGPAPQADSFSREYGFTANISASPSEKREPCRACPLQDIPLAVPGAYCPTVI